MSILTNNRSRFKCGREIKKRTTIWGLRVRLPPPCPVVNLPETGNIDDNVLRSCWGANKRLQYLPPQIGLVKAELVKAELVKEELVKEELIKEELIEH